MLTLKAERARPREQESLSRSGAAARNTPLGLSRSARVLLERYRVYPLRRRGRRLSWREVVTAPSFQDRTEALVAVLATLTDWT